LDIAPDRDRTPKESGKDPAEVTLGAKTNALAKSSMSL
jgi:hypothetical protein